MLRTLIKFNITPVLSDRAFSRICSSSIIFAEMNTDDLVKNFWNNIL